MAASDNIQLIEEIGNYGSIPVKASTTIYGGAMVGDDGSGYGRGLVAGDPFLGHAERKADNSTGANGAINARVKAGAYRLQVAVVGATGVGDVGEAVYASADDTYTLTSTDNTLVGKVVRHVTGTTCIVEFRPLGA